MDRIVKIVAGYDCIRFKCEDKSCRPGSGGSHGKHGADLCFYVKGSRGAIQFILNIGLLPQSCRESKIGSRIFDTGGGLNPVDLGIHSKKPLYDDQKVTRTSCEFCDDLPCYYDGSGINAYDALYAMANGGDEALWEFLEGYYRSVFHGFEYPKPREYDKKTR